MFQGSLVSATLFDQKDHSRARPRFSIKSIGGMSDIEVPWYDVIKRSGGPQSMDEIAVERTKWREKCTFAIEGGTDRR